MTDPTFETCASDPDAPGSGFWKCMSADDRLAFATVTGKFCRVLLFIRPLTLIFHSFLALGDPNQAVFFGSMGIAAALVFANLGSAYGTAKSGVGIVSVAVLKPELLFKSIIPVVMAGVLGMYGMIIAILMKQNSKYNFNHLNAPL